MEKFQTFTGIVAQLDHSNVDTDAIIPKQFLKSIQRTGFGPNLFDEWRYLDYGEPGQDCSTRQKNPDFILNHEPYSSAGILLTRKNFGCGSSREHAPWALSDFGIKVILAESFADIFYNNCFKNGILPIVLNEKTIAALFASAEEKPIKLTINLRGQIIEDEKGNQIAFDVDPYRKHCLLEGLDEIGLTLKNQEVIQRFEENHRLRFPWLF